MKLLFLFSLIFCSLLSFGQNIAWSPTYKLSWDDFRGELGPHSADGALSTVGINRDCAYDNGILTARIEAVFSPDNSSAKEKDKTPEVLGHEQLHFDISELFARKLRKQITESRFPSRPKKAIDKIARLHNQIKADVARYHDQYDEETTLPADPEKQREWNEKVASGLAGLKDYSNPVIEIRLK